MTSPQDPSPGNDAEPENDPVKPAPAGKAPSEKAGFDAVTAAVGRVLGMILKPIVWLLRPLVFRISTEGGVPKVYFTSFSTLMYLWPIMVVGWVGSSMIGWGLVGPSVMGWIWITVVMLVILAIGADTDRNKTLVIFLIVLLLWVGGLLLEEKKGIPILSHIYDFFAAQNVRFDPGTARVFSYITLIVLVGVVLVAWFDGRYEITTREISHKRVLRTSDSLPRAAKRIKRDWRDLTEVLLGLGAGDLIVQDANMHIVMRIPNVPFLWFFRHDVDHILEVLATSEVEEAAALEEGDLA